MRPETEVRMAEVAAAVFTAFTLAWPWNALADCESGDGDGKRPYRVTWRYDGLFDGGFQFQPSTCTSYKSSHHPRFAYSATPPQQLRVARRVLNAQGWKAWPVCSRKIGQR